MGEKGGWGLAYTCRGLAEFAAFDYFIYKAG
jgi:hypothetical protein